LPPCSYTAMVTSKLNPALPNIGEHGARDPGVVSLPPQDVARTPAPPGSVVNEATV
jgi:hypothetical protein